MKDDNAIKSIDEPHSLVEARFGVIGKTRKARILFLVYTLRYNHIRVLHARNANKKEVELYEEKIDNS